MFEPSPQLLKRCFPPVVDDRTRLLLLGSLPGEESLARGQYYANPRNQFWRLIGAVIERDLVGLDYEARLESLLAAGVGLWDTVAEANRTGSLDTAIRGHQANDLQSLADSLPGAAGDRIQWRQGGQHRREDAGIGYPPRADRAAVEQSGADPALSRQARRMGEAQGISERLNEPTSSTCVDQRNWPTGLIQSRW